MKRLIMAFLGLLVATCAVAEQSAWLLAARLDMVALRLNTKSIQVVALNTLLIQAQRSMALALAFWAVTNNSLPRNLACVIMRC